MELHNVLSNCHRIILELASEIEATKPQIEGYVNKIKVKYSFLTLCDRYSKHREVVLAFAILKNIPFTNKQAERNIRPTKSKMKLVDASVLAMEQKSMCGSKDSSLPSESKD